MIINHESDKLTYDRYKELMHLGVQASLPARIGHGFAPCEVALPEGSGTVDVANMEYGDFPAAIHEQYLGMAVMVSAYLAYVVVNRIPMDEDVFLEGREWVYRGSVGGLNSTSLYANQISPGSNPEQLGEVERRYYGYDDYASPDMQRADENMLNLGILALRRADLFPSLADRLPKPEHRQFIANERGMREGEVHGLAVINRVVRVSGPATELQSALLREPDDDPRR